MALRRLAAVTLLLCMGTLVALAQHGAAPRLLRVGVVLPLKEASQRGQKMVEFYQGVLLAVDSLRHNGVSVDIVARHSGTTETEMSELLAGGELADRDVVFGPLDAAQLPTLSDYCLRHGTRLVVPFTASTAQLRTNPLMYLVTAPRAQIQAQAAAVFNQQFSNSHFVFVEAGDANDEGRSMELQLRSVLNARGAFLRTVEIDADDDSYAMAFNPLRHNVVVVNSATIRAINKLMPRLRDYQRANPDCQITLLGYPSWQTFTSTLLADFYRFDTHIYTSFYRNPLALSTRQFDQLYQYWFHQPMQNTFPRWGMMGFDVAWYFLKGLATYGDALESNLQNLHPAHYQTPMLFALPDTGGGHLNICVEVVHYTREQTIEVE